MKKNLILAMTPLHIIICERIMERRKDEIFDIIFLGDGSSKSKYYFGRISLIVDQAYYVNVNSRKNLFLRIFYAFYFMFIFLINRYRYDGLILGNLNIKLNFLAILILSFKEIYTYDDGLVNLIENGDYSTSNKKSFFSRNKILNSSKIHYTIFDAKNTAKCQIERIFLLNKNHMVNKKKGKISIFLGQPLQELDPKFNRIYIGNLLDKLNVDIYFSHPREKKGEYELNYIDSELIVEDYIVDLIRRGFDLNVYGFYSTALLNIKSAFPELKVYYVYDREIFECPKILGVENILIQFNVEKF